MSRSKPSSTTNAIPDIGCSEVGIAIGVSLEQPEIDKDTRRTKNRELFISPELDPKVPAL
jgi:hypothetical protein